MVAERFEPGEPADAAALRLARAKAEDVAGRIGPGPALVLAADTIVAIEGEPLGKPTDRAAAVVMLERLSGRTHEVHTGFVVLEHLPGVVNPPGCPEDAPEAPRSRSGRLAPERLLPERIGRTGSRASLQKVTGCRGEALPGPVSRRIERVVTTRVRVKRLTPAEIAGYVATGEPFDKAGGYALQGAGAFMIEGVEGSVTNVIGLPLVEVLEALAALGGPGPFGIRGR